MVMAIIAVYAISNATSIQLVYFERVIITITLFIATSSIITMISHDDCIVVVNLDILVMVMMNVYLICSFDTRLIGFFPIVNVNVMVSCCFSMES